MKKHIFLIPLLLISLPCFSQEILSDIKSQSDVSTVNEEFRKLNTVYVKFKDVVGMTGTCLAATNLTVVNGLITACS